MGKIPFAAGLFWKTFIVIVALVVITWFVVVKISGYAITPADYGGTTISTILFSYLVHLWLLPSEQLNREDDHPEQGAP